jgi:hypothetical protein
VAAERLDHLVVARLRRSSAATGVAVEELHRVLLEPPDAVVAHDADDVDAVARERVELHPPKPNAPSPSSSTTWRPGCASFAASA